MYCRNCRKEIPEDTKFCPDCGTSTGAAPAQLQYQPPVIDVVNNNVNHNSGFGYIHKNRWDAFFLWLFLGWLGAHRFYVGKIGTGLSWLPTCGFFGNGWLLDLIIILLGGFRDKAGQPLS